MHANKSPLTSRNGTSLLDNSSLEWISGTQASQGNGQEVFVQRFSQQLAIGPDVAFQLLNDEMQPNNSPRLLAGDVLEMRRFRLNRRRFVPAHLMPQGFKSLSLADTLEHHKRTSVQTQRYLGVVCCGDLYHTVCVTNYSPNSRATASAVIGSF